MQFLIQTTVKNDSYINIILYHLFCVFQKSTVSLHIAIILLWVTLSCNAMTLPSTPRNIKDILFHRVKPDSSHSIEKRNAQRMCSPFQGNCNSEEINKLSICPWTLRTSVNRMRRPRRIKEAVCDCERPMISSSLPLVCRPVYRTFSVKLLDRRTRRYRRKLQRVAVACTAIPNCSTS
jgi:hypothetical protein